MTTITTVGSTRWESAYQAFETPAEEQRKFLSRLRRIGADRWDRTARVVEICAGRGSGLRAWHALGFHNVIGVDLSPALVAAHIGPGRCVLGDARSLPLPTYSQDVAIVQGGLHHLATFEDVDLALAEMRRVVVPNGRVVIIEPWLTPFLHVVHALSELQPVRRLVPKVDAFATMTEEESETYFRWLNAPDDLLALIRRHIEPGILWRRWGKLTVVGAPLAAQG
jgi:ubiquinone/menaquinone biosynthesis C-methylase UbiE